MRRPNILLITADDMNYDSPGVCGAIAPDVTPNIDRLASEGVRFVHGHVTIAVCQPSRNVLMTGRYPHRNGGPGFDPISRDVTTLQERLSAAGYLNGILGKTEHLQPADKFCWDMSIEYVTSLGLGRDPERYYHYTTEFLKMAKKQDKPFFLMANSHDPHRPFAGSDQERDMAAEHSVVFPPASRYYTPEEVEVPGFLPDLPEVRREIAEYYTSVHRCDETVGAVLQALDESGLADNTLVMFLSDNGMAFPFAKTNCYLTSTRTPWIVRWPGHVQRDRVDRKHFVSGIDYMPTILDAVGLDQEPAMDGTSFLQLLETGEQAGHEQVFTVFNTTAGRKDYPMRALQNKRYGYIFNAWSDGEYRFVNESQSGRTMPAMLQAAGTDPDVSQRVQMFLYRVPEELYDFESDPHALYNLIEHPDHQTRIQSMRLELLRLMKDSDDPISPLLENHIDSFSANC